MFTNIPEKYVLPEVDEKHVNISLDNLKLIAADLKVKDSLNRRKLIQTPLLNGKIVSSFGEYIPRSLTFASYLRVPENHPGHYDELFNYLMNKPVWIMGEVIGDGFEAHVEIHREPVQNTTHEIRVEFNVKEV